MDAVTALAAASGDLLRRVQAIQPDQWLVPEVCGAWNTRQLVSHVLNGCYLTTALLEGASRQDVLAMPPVRVGDDIVERLDDALAKHTAAFSQPGIFDVMLDHPGGPMLAKHLIGYRTVDFAAHAWDLSRALGFDEQLDPEAVEYCWGFLQPLAPVIGRLGLFGDGPSATLPESASLQTRMLDFTGRRP